MQEIGKKLKEFFIVKRNINIIILLLLAIIICIPIFSENYPINRDDGIQHVYRLIGTMDSLKDNQAIPMIMPKLANNFGYSWSIFYSPLTAFVPLFFKFFVSSYVVALKLFMLAVLFLSGAFMYQYLKKITKENDKVALIGGALYMIAPYHLTDLYLRISIAELTSFVFLPLVFLGMYQLFHDKTKQSYFLAIGAVGLILSHSIATMLTIPFCFIYLLCYGKKLKQKEVLKALFINIIFIILLTLFFTIPLLEHKLATEYDVFIPDRMGSLESAANRSIEIGELFHVAEKDDLVFLIGLPTLVLLALTPLVIKEMDKTKRKELICFLILGLLCTIMTLTIFPFEKLPGFFGMIQFPWRFLEFSSFFFTIVCTLNIDFLIKKITYRDVAVFLLIFLLYTIYIRFSVEINQETFDEKTLLEGPRIEKTTGRVHAGCASFEYLPHKAFINRDYISEREDKIYVLSGDINITKEEKEGTRLKADITAGQKEEKEKNILELPYIYYLGYEVKLIDSKGETSVLETRRIRKRLPSCSITRRTNRRISRSKL